MTVDPWQLLELPAEGPLAVHPTDPAVAWAVGRELWRWTPADGASVWARLPSPCLDLLLDAEGRLWTVDAKGAAVWEGDVERDRWDGLGGEWLRPTGDGGVELVQRGWLDGHGPYSRSWRLAPGEEPEGGGVEPPGEIPTDAGPIVLPGGRYRVERRDGRRGVWDDHRDPSWAPAANPG